MSEPDIDYCQRCGRPAYLWEATGCDECAVTVKEFELVGTSVKVSEGWQGSPWRHGDATCIKALFALKAREIRQRVGRWVTRKEVVEALRPPVVRDESGLMNIANTSYATRMALGEIAAGRRLADYYRSLMNTA